MRIGEVAEISDIPASTLRYYEKIGLIPRARRVHGQREYAPEILRTLTLIKLAQSSGYTLAGIKTWLALMDDPAEPSSWRESVNAKMREIQDTIAQYQKMMRRLQHISDCPCETPRTCIYV